MARITAKYKRIVEGSDLKNECDIICADRESKQILGCFISERSVQKRTGKAPVEREAVSPVRSYGVLALTHGIEGR